MGEELRPAIGRPRQRSAVDLEDDLLDRADQFGRLAVATGIVAGAPMRGPFVPTR